MKLFRSANQEQPASGPSEYPGLNALRAGHLGMPYGTLGLDDFGIIGTHRLPLDWIAPWGGDTDSIEGRFPY